MEHAQQLGATRSVEGNGTLQRLPLNELHPAPWNARKYFDKAALNDLAKDLQVNGQTHPVVVRPRPEGGYEVVAGERRFRASQIAGFERIDAVVREMTDVEARRQSISENLNREDLNPYEETVGILDLISLDLANSPKWMDLLDEEQNSRDATAWVLRSCAKAYPEVHPKVLLKLGLEARELETIINTVFGERAGMTVRSFVNNRLPLLRLPEEVREALEEGWIEYSKANLIAGVQDSNDRQELLSRAINEGLTWKQLNDLANAIKDTKSSEENEALKEMVADRNGINRYWRYATSLKHNEQRKLARLVREARELLKRAADRETNKTK